MSTAQSFSGDLKVLWHLLTARGRGADHSQRLDNFYAGQAQHYDDFRRRLLHGRQELFDAVEVPQDGVWVDIGAGTGENAERLAQRLGHLRAGYLVDLCQPLLAIAEQRIATHSWKNMHAVHADGTRFTPPDGPVDLVTFSYSLTMIPDWYRAIDDAWQMLKPGGQIAIVDFYVARKYPEQGHRQHHFLTRHLWPMWFNHDNVYPSTEHLPYLEYRFERVLLEEQAGKIPYLPFVRMPYYRFIGRKPA